MTGCGKRLIFEFRKIFLQFSQKKLLKMDTNAAPTAIVDLRSDTVKIHRRSANVLSHCAIARTSDVRVSLQTQS